MRLDDDVVDLRHVTGERELVIELGGVEDPSTVEDVVLGEHASLATHRQPPLKLALDDLGFRA